jgi:2-polyprenyl-3-methyl-5-hydroxy-6-metoxy-1,4-benzoquinol methylase
MAEAARWSDLGADPNAPAVLAERRRLLAATRRPPVARRDSYLTELVRARRVLDVGVVEHQVSSSASPGWLHRRLADAAASCVGVDILPEAVAALAQAGYDVRCVDLTVERLDDTFDVIVVGEVLEHVGAPEALLANAGAMLAPDGVLVLTTPNPYALHRAWQGLRGRPKESADHVALYATTHLVELAARSGLTVRAWRGVRLKNLRTPRGRAAAAVRAVATRLLSPEVACDSLCYELVPARR